MSEKTNWEELFEKVNQENKSLFIRKNREYDSAFVPLGVNGLFVMLWGDVHKLKVATENNTISLEKKRDILQDISVTANMALMLMKVQRGEK